MLHIILCRTPSSGHVLCAEFGQQVHKTATTWEVVTTATSGSHVTVVYLLNPSLLDARWGSAGATSGFALPSPSVSFVDSCLAASSDSFKLSCRPVAWLAVGSAAGGLETPSPSLDALSASGMLNTTLEAPGKPLLPACVSCVQRAVMRLCQVKDCSKMWCRAGGGCPVLSGGETHLRFIWGCSDVRSSIRSAALSDGSSRFCWLCCCCCCC